jgi:hypothetical protein
VNHVFNTSIIDFPHTKRECSLEPIPVEGLHCPDVLFAETLALTRVSANAFDLTEFS